MNNINDGVSLYSTSVIDSPDRSDKEECGGLPPALPESATDNFIYLLSRGTHK